MAFGKAGAGFISHEGTMVEGGRGQGKRTEEQELAGGGEQEVRAANDFGDLHGGIVHDDGELIRGNVVMTPDDEIAEVFAGDELLGAEISVGE